MGTDLFRKDETIVHESIREAFVNALIHADFRGQGGVVIEKSGDRLELSNPGTLLLSIEQLLRGGISECRNKSLPLMFQQIGGGEKAGSGLDKIRQGWASQQWRWPLIEQQLRPDRVKLILPMVSLLPEGALERLRAALGDDPGRLNGREVQVLVTADVEGTVNNLRLQQLSTDHTSEIMKMLKELCGKGHLVKGGHGGWAKYRLSDGLRKAAVDRATPHATPDSAHNVGRSEHTPTGTPHADPENDPLLLEIAAVAREKARMSPEGMARLIESLCDGRYLTPRQIGMMLYRNPIGVQQRFLRPMAKRGALVLLFPDEPNHPNQAYKTKRSRRQ